MPATLTVFFAAILVACGAMQRSSTCGQRAPYDLRRAGGFVADYLPAGADGADASPLLRIRRGAPPMIIAFGSLEQPYVAGSRASVDALIAAGHNAQIVSLMNRNDSLWRTRDGRQR